MRRVFTEKGDGGERGEGGRGDGGSKSVDQGGDLPQRGTRAFSGQNINASKPFFAPQFFALGFLAPKMCSAKKHGLLSVAFTLLMSFPDSSNCSGFHWLSAFRR